MSDTPSLSEILQYLDDLNFSQLENVKVLGNGLGRPDLMEISDLDAAAAAVEELLETDARAASVLNVYWKTRPKSGSN
ncbi:hypothetical protein [Bradyrhizobium sp. AZCC 2230]|uniref:hypothetical protein n=1 Tax=Bradyrhizobium sp. AZCC 2230 TaxID=3117021 RepID=UPI002FEEAECF